MAIAWNIVNHTGEAFEFVSDKVRRKIGKIETILRRFPQDAIHLQIILDEEPKRKSYTVKFNLRIPSNVLSVRKESKSLVQALDDATRSLLLRLEKDKSRRRNEHLRRRCPKGMPRDDGFSELPLVEGTKPQSHVDLVSEVIEKNHKRLLRFANRQINQYVAAGTVPEDTIDPREIVDRVAEVAITNPESKPESMDYPTWCSTLAFKQTRAAVREYLTDASQAVPIDLDVGPALDERSGDDPDIEAYALSVLHDVIEPEEATLADYIADTRVNPPDVSVAEREMVETLRRISRSWPKIDREVFEMHYLEGLNAEDIADALKCRRQDVSRALDRIQNTIRRRLHVIADDDQEGSNRTVVDWNCGLRL